MDFSKGLKSVQRIQGKNEGKKWPKMAQTGSIFLGLKTPLSIRFSPPSFALQLIDNVSTTYSCKITLAWYHCTQRCQNLDKSDFCAFSQPFLQQLYIDLLISGSWVPPSGIAPEDNTKGSIILIGEYLYDTFSENVLDLNFFHHFALIFIFIFFPTKSTHTYDIP